MWTAAAGRDMDVILSAVGMITRGGKCSTGVKTASLPPNLSVSGRPTGNYLVVPSVCLRFLCKGGPPGRPDIHWTARCCLIPPAEELADIESQCKETSFGQIFRVPVFGSKRNFTIETGPQSIHEKEVQFRVQMRAFSAAEESLTQTKETKMDQCERVRVN